MIKFLCIQKYFSAKDNGTAMNMKASLLNDSRVFSIKCPIPQEREKPVVDAIPNTNAVQPQRNSICYSISQCKSHDIRWYILASFRRNIQQGQVGRKWIQLCWEQPMQFSLNYNLSWDGQSLGDTITDSWRNCLFFSKSPFQSTEMPMETYGHWGSFNRCIFIWWKAVKSWSIFRDRFDVLRC